MKRIFFLFALCALCAFASRAQQYTGMSGMLHIPSAEMHDEGDARIWSYTIAVGTAGNRTFAVKAAASDFVYVGSAQAMVTVK